MKYTQYVGVCVQSLTVPMTYSSSQSLLQTWDALVPSPHSQTRCLFTVVQDSDSSRSGAVMYWQSNGQTGKWVGVLWSPWGGVRFLRVGLCGHVTRYMFHERVCVCVCVMSRGWHSSSVTNRPLFSPNNIRPLPTLPAFLGILAFSISSVFSSPIELSHLSTPRGAGENKAKCMKEAGHSVRVINKKGPLINDSYHVLSPWRRPRQRG